MGFLVVKKVRLEFGPQQCFLSQKYASPRFRNLMMRSLNSRCTFFDSMICIKLFGSELKAHYFSNFLVSNSRRTLLLDSHR